LDQGDLSDIGANTHQQGSARFGMPSELQAVLADARRRADDPSGVIAAAQVPCISVPGKPALLSIPCAGGIEETVGPPFFNRAYVVSVWEKKKESLTRRFTTETFNAFDIDGDGLLNADEFESLVRVFYSALRLRPAHGLAARLWASTESLDREAFNAVFAELHKGVVFKIRVAGTEECTPGGNSPRPLSPGGPMVRSECLEFPKGLRVEITSFRRCHPQSAAAAKKLRLRRFHAAEGRLPPRSRLEVLGSFMHTGDPNEGITHGEYVVGIRDESGQEYLIDSRGLRREELSEEEKGEAGEGRRRGREVAAELGQCLTVQQVSHFFEHGHTRSPCDPQGCCASCIHESGTRSDTFADLGA